MGSLVTAEGGWNVTTKRCRNNERHWPETNRSMKRYDNAMRNKEKISGLMCIYLNEILDNFLSYDRLQVRYT